MDLAQIQCDIHRITHWCDIEKEMPLLYRYISALEPGQTYLEVGTGPTGCTAVLAALSVAPGVNVHTVDSGVFLEEKFGTSPAQYAEKIRQNFASFGVLGRIQFHVEDSIEMEWDGTPIDVLFIDGAHDRVSVVADIEKWTPFVPVGGVVLFHDCKTHQGVGAAVTECMGGNDEWRELDNSPAEYMCIFERVISYRLVLEMDGADMEVFSYA